LIYMSVFMAIALLYNLNSSLVFRMDEASEQLLVFHS